MYHQIPINSVIYHEMDSKMFFFLKPKFAEDNTINLLLTPYSKTTSKTIKEIPNCYLWEYHTTVPEINSMEANTQNQDPQCPDIQ